MDTLTAKKCVPCEGMEKPMNKAQIAPYLAQIKEWKVVEDKKLEREFKCKDFAETMSFINAVGEVAETEGHHPDIYLHGWNKVTFTLWTHAIGGLSLNDFILAAKIDEVSARLSR